MTWLRRGVALAAAHRMLLIGLGTGILLGYFGERLAPWKTQAFLGTQLRAHEPQYALIDPLVACISADKSYFDDLDGLNSALQKTINRAYAEGKASRIAVYFRELNTGHWTGINEGERFFPASLFKVPIMMAYFKKAETNPGLLKRRLSVPLRVAAATPAVTPSALQPGRSYTIEKLIASMIVSSDNEAKDILLDHIDQNILEGILRDLEIDFPADIEEKSEYGISARKYSLLFRALYNATLLRKDMSEKALELLGRSEFKEGIAAGVPTGVPVAHKFGAHISPPIGNELHDCGVVYHPTNPYFLCVMTKGERIERLPSVIQDISALVYKKADQKNK